MNPYLYAQPAADVLRGLSQAAAARNAVEAQKGEDDLANKKREFAQRYALQSLQNEVDQKRQRDEINMSRMRGAYGAAGNLLRGLFN